MQKAFFLLLILPIMIIPAFALESDTEYFISSDSVYLIFQVGAANENTLADGGITINDVLYEIDIDQVKTWRVTNDGDYGRIFGQTIDGDNYYLIYDMKGNEGKVLLKIWQDENTTRLIEDADIDRLF